jgi:GntR family transcriptional regulator/MocR family aminotransferase
LIFLTIQMSEPIFGRIASQIASDIREGRLVPGERLPGSRALARLLHVGRDTVLAAYRDLEAQGWIASESRRGTIVADVPESHAKTASGLSKRLGFDIDDGPEALPAAPEKVPGAIALFGGVPDLRLVPAELVARAYRRAVRRHARSVLGYSADPRGHERLRTAIARLLRQRRGIVATADEILVTRGSQMAIHLFARAIVRPGDTVAVEALGYRPAWAILERAGAKLVGIPVDGEGIDVATLENVRRNVRAVYVTPHHQYPTTAVLTAARRVRLLELAKRNRMAILEDDYDHEFHYEGRPVLPLASADANGSVVYVGTLSKILAPGLRLGFVAAPKPLVDRLARERFLVDRQGDLALELAVAELIEDDELGRHARKMKRAYLSRRDALAEALAKIPTLSFRVPSGGMAMWATVDPSIDVDAWSRRAEKAGVLFQPGSTFALAKKKIHAARFGFAMCTEAEIATAGERLKRSLPK